MAEIERWTPSSLGVRNINAVRISAAILIVVTLVAAIMVLQVDQSRDSPTRESPAGIEYTSHSPIRINNNSDFAAKASSEGWNGTGSELYPYKIENYEISTTIGRDAIYIGNTTCHFMINGCYIHDASDSGIELYRVSNGTLMNNTFGQNLEGIFLDNSNNITISNNSCISDNWDGITLDSSDDNLISNNTCTDIDYGISLYLSGRNRIADNNCSANWIGGIWVDQSDGNTICNNSFLDNADEGIHLYYSDSTTVTNNTITNSFVFGIYMFGCSFNVFTDNNLAECGFYMRGASGQNWNSHSIDTSNLVNGKPVRYIKDQTGGIVASGAGQVIIANCNGVTVKDQVLNNASVGIVIGNSWNTIVENCTCSYEYYGILLQQSQNSKIRNCSFTNDVEGVYIVAANSIRISNNAYSNNSIGLHLYTSSGDRIDNNLFLDNSGYAIYLEWGSTNRIWNNTFIDNHGAGSIRDPAHVQAYDAGTINFWNTSGTPHGYGNNWSDWRAPDDNWDGIVDNSYNLSGSSGAKDYYPLTTPGTPIPEPSVLILAGIMMMIFLITGRRKGKKRFDTLSTVQRD